MSELALNSIAPVKGTKHRRKRVGRGPGSGKGKTCGRGHKGQKSRSGYSAKPGFEGGQMPIQRRLPKSGFNSHKARITCQVRLSELNLLPDGTTVTMDVLKKAGIISGKYKRAKVIASGELNNKINISGLAVTKGARAAIEAQKGKIED